MCKACRQRSIWARIKLFSLIPLKLSLDDYSTPKLIRAGFLLASTTISIFWPTNIPVSLAIAKCPHLSIVILLKSNFAALLGDPAAKKTNYTAYLNSVKLILCYILIFFFDVTNTDINQYVLILTSIDLKKNPHSKNEGNLRCLAVTYFHMRKHTIIGATSFHSSVRDGKMWVQSTMAAKRNFS